MQSFDIVYPLVGPSGADNLTVDMLEDSVLYVCSQLN